MPNHLRPTNTRQWTIASVLVLALIGLPALLTLSACATDASTSSSTSSTGISSTGQQASATPTIRIFQVTASPTIPVFHVTAGPTPTVRRATATATIPVFQLTVTPIPKPHQPVTAYNNYGSANAGYAMCRGNPNSSLSMPGGTVTQTFNVPTGVATLNSSKVQIDPDSTVTAHLTLAVNGVVAATTSAVAAGDTQFTFGAVPVRAGDKITLTITFSATYGKIITVYTAGNPGGTFTTSNTCPDGASNVTLTNTGLRAVVSGMS